MSKNNKWIKIKDSYPKDGEEVQIQDNVGKIGKAIYCGNINSKLGGAGWMIESGMNFKDFAPIEKWRRL